MSDEQKPAAFTQIGVGRDGLFALDANGGVWRYYPADKPKGTYAAWYRLTEFRVDNVGKRKSERRHPFEQSSAHEHCNICEKPATNEIHH